MILKASQPLHKIGWGRLDSFMDNIKEYTHSVPSDHLLPPMSLTRENAYAIFTSEKSRIWKYIAGVNRKEEKKPVLTVFGLEHHNLCFSLNSSPNFYNKPE